MKKYILTTIMLAAILSFSCNSSNDHSGYNNKDSVSGNTDSAGSQPAEPAAGSAQPDPGAASSGNRADTITRERPQPPRADSVIRH